MELKKAIEILEKHNYWRRDNSDFGEIGMISPKELGIAIDKIVEHFKNNVLLHNVSTRFNSDLRDKFFKECTDPSPNSGRNAGIRPLNMTAHNIYEWFKKNVC